MGSQATNDDPVAAIQSNRFDIAIEAARLAGPGAKKLLSTLPGACYVYLGEEHGMAEVAEFADAFTRELQPLGFNTFALEISASMARQLSSELESRDPAQAHLRFVSEQPMTLPFYNTREEFLFLEHAKARSGSAFKLIGLDQEFLGSAKFLLQEVGRQNLTHELRRRLDQFSEEEQQAWTRAKGTGRYQDLFLLSANEAGLEKFASDLKDAGFDAKPLEDLLLSRRIYDLFARNNYESNAARDRAMKRAFVAAHHDVPPCNVFVKTGSNHGFRGLGPLRTREFGNFLAEVSDGYSVSGGVHILIGGAKGEELAFDAVGKPMKTQPVDALSSDFALHALKPFIEAALQQSAWSLFDLRPLRSAQATRSADLELQSVIYAYDFMVIVPHPTASHEIQ